MKYKSESFDKLQYLFDITGFNDHQVHCVIHFKNSLNVLLMKRAVTLLIKAVPILSRVYGNDGGDSWWEDAVPSEWMDLFTIVDNKEDFDRFTFSKTDEAAGPQIKVCLLQSGRDAVSVVMNHMVSDGAGFKQCIYLLSEIYSNLIKDPDYVPTEIIDGDRGFRQITKEIGLLLKIKILLFGRKDNNQSSECEFPMSRTQETAPFIMTHEILQARYGEIRDFCKNSRVTVNDVILTAYFRALSGFLNRNGKELDIPIMIDMRRYLKEKDFNALTNLSSTAIIRIAVAPGEDFSQTLNKVSAQMDAKKSEYLGMNTFLKLDLLFKLFPKRAFTILRSSLNNPKICMTNIGVLDSKKLLFENAPVENAIICGSIKYRPHFQMSASTFEDKMTFCVNLYGDKSDRDVIAKFFSFIDKELMSFANPQNAVSMSPAQDA